MYGVGTLQVLMLLLIILSNIIWQNREKIKNKLGSSFLNQLFDLLIIDYGIITLIVVSYLILIGALVGR
jgi:hypothetical protein